MLAIFDMDGTLVDSSILLTNSINYVRSKLNLPPMPKDNILKGIADANCNIPQYFYNIDKIEPIHEKWFQEYFSLNHNKELILFDGVEQMLKDIKNLGFKLAIATNAYRVSALESLKHLKIYNYFDDIVTFDEVKKGKPSPKMLEVLLKRFNIANSDAIFVGDSDRDYLASKNAKIKFLRVDFSKIDKNCINEPKEIVKIMYNFKKKDNNDKE